MQWSVVSSLQAAAGHACGIHLFLSVGLCFIDLVLQLLVGQSQTHSKEK